MSPTFRARKLLILHTPSLMVAWLLYHFDVSDSALNDSAYVDVILVFGIIQSHNDISVITNDTRTFN